MSSAGSNEPSSATALKASSVEDGQSELNQIGGSRRAFMYRRKALRWFLRGGVIYAMIVIVMMLLETTLMFPAPSLSRGDWDPAHFGARESYLDSEQSGKVHVWEIRNSNAKATLIFCHGNAETLGILGPELKQISERWSVNVVGFDYRGYGKTGGNPGEKLILADATAVGEMVLSSAAYKGLPTIVFGRSLGGAPAVEIAHKLPVDGLILDRTFSSTLDVAQSRYFFLPVRWIMRNQFRSDKKIVNYQGPLLQMHGEVDEVIPYRFGKKLFELAPTESKELYTVSDLYHNDPWPGQFWQKGADFVKTVSLKRQSK